MYLYIAHPKRRNMVIRFEIGFCMVLPHLIFIFLAGLNQMIQDHVALGGGVSFKAES